MNTMNRRVASREIVLRAILYTTLSLFSSAKAECTIGNILESIERNNIDIQLMQQQIERRDKENSSTLSVGELSVSYSSFQNRRVGTAGSELVATQSFDFPTQYISRSRQIDIKRENLNLELESVRRSILLQARLICLELITLRQENSIISQRLYKVDLLEESLVQQVAKGNATAIEMNRIKMERMRIESQRTNNIAMQESLMLELQLLNGNITVAFSDTLYPNLPILPGYTDLRDELLAANIELQQSEGNRRVANMQVGIERQHWLPELEVGYRRNTDQQIAMHGFVVGGAIPLFSNRRQVQIAKAEALEAELWQKQVIRQVDNAILTQYNEVKQLEGAILHYDTEVITSSLNMLHQALECGEITLYDYITESETIYATIMEYISMNHRYQRAMAILLRDISL